MTKNKRNRRKKNIKIWIKKMNLIGPQILTGR